MRNGRVLLHDEVEGQRGNFEVIPIWETVGENDVLTPREVYELVISEGYRVDYARLAITDEQAPIPDVFSHLENRVQLALDTGAAFADEPGTDDDGHDYILSAADTNLNSNARDKTMDREDQVYLAGEYRVILQLVGVIRGKPSMISNFKCTVRIVATKKYRHLSLVYANHLQRFRQAARCLSTDILLDNKFSSALEYFGWLQPLERVPQYFRFVSSDPYGRVVQIESGGKRGRLQRVPAIFRAKITSHGVRDRSLEPNFQMTVLGHISAHLRSY
ncbi:hypothetical protein CF319_g7897 [Tilletia indica]|nr:hypothetical protein CF319_g7897 [Tilletia indica]